MRTRQIPLLSLLLCTLLAGCGQTGPLYLPEPEPASPEGPTEETGEADASAPPGS